MQYDKIDAIRQKSTQMSTHQEDKYYFVMIYLLFCSKKLIVYVSKNCQK